jgi:peptidoglycan-associated lipoprotein
MSRRAVAVVAVLVAVWATGCAKQPAMTAASAPAPTGQSSTVVPAATSATARPSSVPAGATAKTDARPSPSDFTAITDLGDIHFDFDKYAIRADAERVLDANTVWLKSHARHLLLIEGHCDERGTNEYNLALGERRAKATMNYLTAHGVDARRITVVSYGEERPQCREHSEACWAKNRRARFLVKEQ